MAIGVGDGSLPVCRHPLNRGKAGGSATQWLFASSFALSCPYASAWKCVGGGQQGRLQQRPPTFPCHGGRRFPSQSHDAPGMLVSLKVIESVLMTISPASTDMLKTVTNMKKNPAGTR